MMEEAGFADVSVGRAPTRVPFQLLKGMKTASASAAEVSEPSALVGEAVA